MTGRQLPSPYTASNWTEWALKLVEHFETAPTVDQQVEPSTPLLAHQMGDERAAVDGVLMYDPAAAAVVLSRAGVWEQFYTKAEVDQLILDALVWTVGTYSVAAYAGMESQDWGVTDLGIGWTPVTGYDIDRVPPRGIVTNLANGTMTFSYEGVYQISFFCNLQGHNSSNSGRVTNFRMFNVDDGIPGASVAIGIGRNTEDTVISLNVLAEITAGAVNKAFRAELGGGDAITGIDSAIVNFSANNEGEWRGAIPGT